MNIIPNTRACRARILCIPAQSNGTVYASRFNVNQQVTRETACGLLIRRSQVRALVGEPESHNNSVGCNQNRAAARQHFAEIGTPMGHSVPNSPIHAGRRDAHRYLVIFSVALVCACGKGPLETTKQPDKTAACMQFWWSTPEQIKATCGVDAFYGLSNQACLVNGYLYVGPKPRDFNDEAALLSIGHEAWHALGAEHK